MSQTHPTAVIVLAAGQGTRMKSALPKVMHPIGGRSLLHHSVAAAAGTSPEHLIVVVRHERDQLVAHLDSLPVSSQRTLLIADQDEVPGTGRATECALTQLPEDLSGTVVVTYGDVPLLTTETINGLVEIHESNANAVTVLSAEVNDPTGYGRIVRDANGSLLRIVEQKDAGDEERAIREINSGIYAFDAAALKEGLASLTTDNAQGEKYLTDVIGHSREAGRPVAATATDDLWQVEGANDRVQLANLGKELNRRQCEKFMRAGVSIIDPDTTWIDVDVSIAADATILPGTQLLGATDIGAGAVVGPDTTLKDTEVGENAKVVRTHGELAVVGPEANVGPFAYLRPGTKLGESGKIGTFVETKNADIGKGAKVPHLSYVGDAEIGEGSNIGAASVFVNYDGVNKHRTVIGKHARMGSDNMYVAPVTVGDGAYSGASTTVRKDVPAGALAISVAPQRNLEGWVQTNRPGTPAAQAAENASEGERISE
ncbi:bifunctional UDP-N-acetylglucosamine diphosphorylase/glucosamine-1-phosphate N-acetyltransferase GlmU [Brevibacterium sediminis]|uniref:Bifunctional protein GlmU n=1 Tax=Brevibacterium sediminis TaxID=1857024 RepID=A0A5C4WYR7_9MICO|nr:bifunctional UDP-N-acetylglucosamine diphosphorylase/glucosamine-1-phosphate N-acetyltransferase GlmU [Brevibacterium sediminis]MCS4591402.1 bifunctional UDP-N-acetylglucosamine diphosphorylase/glucosamine-1-phosphate N-acetyltransferase GlmU [Brevibacterium sediminis]TNM53386.1 bifunctional UDP-N-acetylglucosamine diphosphorylase/glucosamine-1-phosphate N-acetyltransferase GlmU [Brevibacterium sediminis]